MTLAIEKIREEFDDRLAYFEATAIGTFEAQRLGAAILNADVEDVKDSFIKGIENYSRYLTNREPGATGDAARLLSG